MFPGGFLINSIKDKISATEVDIGIYILQSVILCLQITSYKIITVLLIISVILEPEILLLHTHANDNGDSKVGFKSTNI